MAADLAPIRVAPSGRYFETADGQPFLFIGANDAVTWPGLRGLYERRDLASVERYLAEYAASGVTIIRLMLEYAHEDGFYFETHPGSFNPLMVQLWDDLLARCAQLGLRVLLTPWDSFWMSRRWHVHPYNQANGGPCARPQEFLTTPAVLDCLARRLRFVVQRWGGSGVIAAWDLFNEIDPYWGGDADAQAASITHISTILREIEERSWGCVRPQTLSVFGPDPQGAYADLIFRHPALDFATTHIYHKGTIDHPADTVMPAKTMAQWVRYACNRVPADRPFTDSEHGPIHLFNDHERWLPEDFDNEYERHLMWAHLASGGAGSGMRWPARHPHVLTPGMRQALGSMAKFSALIDWRSFRPQDVAPLASIDQPTVLLFGSADAQQALIWLLRATPADHPPGSLLPPQPRGDTLQLELHGLQPGSYSISAWDTLRGHCAATLHAHVDASRRLSASIPAFGNDLALAITPAQQEGAHHEPPSI